MFFHKHIKYINSNYSNVNKVSVIVNFIEIHICPNLIGIINQWFLYSFAKLAKVTKKINFFFMETFGHRITNLCLSVCVNWFSGQVLKLNLILHINHH